MTPPFTEAWCQERPRIAWLFVLGLATMVSGCVDRSGQGSADPAGKPPREQATHEPLEILLEDCDGVILGSFIPITWGEPFLPPGFSTRTLSGAEMEIVLQMRDCRRVIANNTVWTDVRWLETGIIMFQEFDDDSPRQTSLLVETWISSPDVGRLLRSAGVPAQDARIEPHPSMGLTPTIGWTITTNTNRLSFQYNDNHIEQGPVEGRFANWYGGPPHLRRQYEVSEMLAHALDKDAVAVEIAGDGPTQRLTGSSGRWLFDDQARWNSQYRFTFLGGFMP